MTAKQVNSVQTIGLIVLLVYIVVATILFGPLIVRKIKEARVRFHDTKIFEAAEEARRDFD